MRSFTTLSFVAVAFLMAFSVQVGAEHDKRSEPAVVQKAAEAAAPGNEGVALGQEAAPADRIAEAREAGGDRNHGDYDIPDPCPG